MHHPPACGVVFVPARPLVLHARPPAARGGGMPAHAHQAAGSALRPPVEAAATPLARALRARSERCIGRQRACGRSLGAESLGGFGECLCSSVRSSSQQQRMKRVARSTNRHASVGSAESSARGSVTSRVLLLLLLLLLTPCMVLRFRARSGWEESAGGADNTPLSPSSSAAGLVPRWSSGLRGGRASGGRLSGGSAGGGGAFWGLRVSQQSGLRLSSSGGGSLRPGGRSSLDGGSVAPRDLSAGQALLPPPVAEEEGGGGNEGLSFLLPRSLPRKSGATEARVHRSSWTISGLLGGGGGGGGSRLSRSSISTTFASQLQEDCVIIPENNSNNMAGSSSKSISSAATATSDSASARSTTATDGASAAAFLPAGW